METILSKILIKMELICPGFKFLEVMPSDWRIVWETTCAQAGNGFNLGSKDLDNYLLGSAQASGRVDAKKINGELNGKKVLDAKSLLYYLENQEIIPEIWKTKDCIYFWGTLFNSKSFSGLPNYVLTLKWYDKEKFWFCSYYNINQSMHCTVPRKIG